MDQTKLPKKCTQAPGTQRIYSNIYTNIKFATFGIISDDDFAKEQTKPDQTFKNTLNGKRFSDCQRFVNNLRSNQM